MALAACGQSYGSAEGPDAGDGGVVFPPGPDASAPTNDASTDAPEVDAPEMTTVRSAAAGAGFTCAIRSDGSLLCWGDNVSGQLGDGTLIARATPTIVSSVTAGATVVSAAQAHACAVISGVVKCWGDNSSAQVGSTQLTERVPFTVTGLGASASTVATAVTHSCAVVRQGGRREVLGLERRRGGPR